MSKKAKNKNLKQFHTLIQNQLTATETFHFAQEIIIVINIHIIKKKQLQQSTPRAHFLIVTNKDDFRTSSDRDPVFTNDFNHPTSKLKFHVQLASKNNKQYRKTWLVIIFFFFTGKINLHHQMMSQ